MKSLILIALFAVAGAGWNAGHAAPSSPLTVRGQVLEVQDVDNYTYLRLKTKDGEQWAAVNRAPVKKGAEVAIENATVMKDFESKTLKRKFATIVFGELAGAPAQAAAASAPAPGSVNAFHSGLPKPADVGDVKVAKATGADARTVAEIAGSKGDLKDKTVVVRGKVVKFTPGILGKNWVHLRDGTGTAADGTDDLVVTTKAETTVGDVVVAKGVVRTNVDLGSGYTYKVLVEEATFTR
ncbi:MAG: nucleotide-binding protein [Burkholderiales bacterium]